MTLRDSKAIALPLAGLIACGTVGAQSANETTPAESTGAGVEEIVVTAQRREERLNDVPITIAAFTSEMLRQTGAQTLKDVAALTPNAQIFENNGSGMPVWIIRGVGIVDFNVNNTPASAVYVDDVYQVSSVFGSIGLFDVERVEVLKGPQGGLYGRNTSGGAVRVITRSPNLERAEGDVTASYGRWGRFQADMGVSIPLIDDKLAVRLSSRVQNSSSGWQYSVPAQSHYGKWDSYAVRGQLLYRPNDSLTIRAIVDTGSDDSEITLPTSAGVYARSEGSGGFPSFCSAVLQGYTDDSCLTFAEVMGNGPFPVGSSKDGERVLSDPFSRNNNDSTGETVIASLDLGGVQLTSVTGHREFAFRQRVESDGTPGEYGHQVNGSLFRVFSQEFRLASDGDGPLTWIVGASYGRDTLNERRTFLSRDNEYFAAIFGSPLIFRLNYDQRSESWAGYGQSDYEISDTITISGALRYTQEEKEYRNGGIGLPGNDNIFATPLSDDYELDARWSGKASISWKPIDTSTLYASVSRGFKTGGFFGGFGFAGQSAIAPYKEETVWAYEIGAKNTFYDNRVGLNAAVFYYDYQDVQSFATEPDPLLGTITRLRNVGAATHIGAELEAYVTPIDGLRLAASVAYLDAEISDSPNNFLSQAGELLTYDGFRRLYAPEWSWTAQASYEVLIGAAGTLRFMADANGRTTIINPGIVVATGQESLVDRAIQRTPGYELVNARITYEPPVGNWDVSVFGRNLLNEHYTTVWGGDGLGSYWKMHGEPVSYGIEASVRW